MSAIDLFLLGYLLLSAGLLLVLWQAGTGRRIFDRAVRVDSRRRAAAGGAGWAAGGRVDASVLDREPGPPAR